MFETLCPLRQHISDYVQHQRSNVSVKYNDVQKNRTAWPGLQRYESTDQRADEADLGATDCPWWASVAQMEYGQYLHPY